MYTQTTLQTVTRQSDSASGPVLHAPIVGQFQFTPLPIESLLYRLFLAIMCMTSSIKPEVHNVSQRHRRGTEPRTDNMCTENLAKIGDMHVGRQTDRQTRPSQDSTAISGAEY